MVHCRQSRAGLPPPAQALAVPRTGIDLALSSGSPGAVQMESLPPATAAPPMAALWPARPR